METVEIDYRAEEVDGKRVYYRLVAPPPVPLLPDLPPEEQAGGKCRKCVTCGHLWLIDEMVAGECVLCALPGEHNED